MTGATWLSVPSAKRQLHVTGDSDQRVLGAAKVYREMPPVAQNGFRRQ
jgi:hypothetical protein